MSSHRMPLVIPLARPWPLRLREAARAAWQDWQGWRRQRLAIRQACALSAQVLDDLGAPEDWRAAAAHCRARAEMERRLLRLGIVPGTGW